MLPDNNLYFIIPSNVGDRVVEALGLAKEMAKEKYPHLTRDILRAERLWKENALTFRGSEKIPASAKPAGYNF